MINKTGRNFYEENYFGTEFFESVFYDDYGGGNPASNPDPSIHKIITGRGFLRSFDGLVEASKNNELPMLSGDKLDLFYELSQAITCTTFPFGSIRFDELVPIGTNPACIGRGAGILSLGEGRSPFTYMLIKEFEYYNNFIDPMVRPLYQNMINNLQAVDIAYPQHDAKGVITDTRKSTKDAEASMDFYDLLMVPIIKQYPNNYRSQLFQDLDIRDNEGSRQKFQIIIANHSLAYVLLSYVDSQTMKKTLLKVLDHLQAGGLLIQKPFSPYQSRLYNNTVEYFNFLKELKEKGIISDYNTEDPIGIPVIDSLGVQVIRK